MPVSKKSVEEKVEDFFKAQLNNFDVRFFAKTEPVNDAIDRALKNSESKSGGKGNNYPDIKVLITSQNQRYIPVMIEAKGTRGKLAKFDKEGRVDLSKSAVTGYALNGAIHYANAILKEGTYREAIAIGLNGEMNGGGLNTEIAVYYVSPNNYGCPKPIDAYLDLSFLKQSNIDFLLKKIDELSLTDEELETAKRKARVDLEKVVKEIHQRLYDDEKFGKELGTNDKLYLFSGLIMAGLSVEGLAPMRPEDLKGNLSEKTHDGKLILSRIEDFLIKRRNEREKIDMIIGLFRPIFSNKLLYTPDNGISPIKQLFMDIQRDIIPVIESRLHVDFTGIILNSLSDWISIENDKKNDVVLTPRYVTNLMARLARTNKDSFVWDTAMGSGGFLISAMELMITDAKKTLKTEAEITEKVENIHKNQLLGIEVLGNIYILAVINMILTGDGSSRVLQGNSFEIEKPDDFPANVFLLNPPYSADGKGFNFVERALSLMVKGYGCVLIQENAGAGKGLPYTKRILERNTLRASIHMADIFKGKAGVQTAIYLFEVGRAHQTDDLVTFIDFSEDGYLRQNRKKSTESVNLQDVDKASERYKEIEAIVLGKKKETDFYNEQNGTVIRDTITLKGNDWTFAQHQQIDTTPTIEDFKKTVKEFLAWKVSQVIKQDDSLGKM